jgi:hypothetical protein
MQLRNSLYDLAAKSRNLAQESVAGFSVDIDEGHSGCIDCGCRAKVRDTTGYRLPKRHPLRAEKLRVDAQLRWRSPRLLFFESGDLIGCGSAQRCLCGSL